MHYVPEYQEIRIFHVNTLSRTIRFDEDPTMRECVSLCAQYDQYFTGSELEIPAHGNEQKLCPNINP
ncbi:hypothetical protein HWI79_3004 [Cryptosporidium felis]|nr:hypothetical protein HWI79_3004 [Cryptosporidium felis]